MKKQRVNLRAFRMENQLSQKEVAEFLGISIAFVSAIERGVAKLPEEKIAMLRANDKGWEASKLDEVAVVDVKTKGGADINVQKVMLDNKYLREEVARLKSEVEYYHKMNDRLLGILEGRCGIKPDEK